MFEPYATDHNLKLKKLITLEPQTPCSQGYCRWGAGSGGLLHCGQTDSCCMHARRHPNYLGEFIFHCGISFLTWNLVRSSHLLAYSHICTLSTMKLC